MLRVSRKEERAGLSCGRSRTANLFHVDLTWDTSFTTVPAFVRRQDAQLLRRSCHPQSEGARHPLRSIAWAFAFRQWLIAQRYPTERFAQRRRRRTFIGQCCQPFCSGDVTSHVDGPHRVTKYRNVERMISPPRFQLAREPDLPSAAETWHLLNCLYLAPPSSVVTTRC